MLCVIGLGQYNGVCSVMEPLLSPQRVSLMGRVVAQFINSGPSNYVSDVRLLSVAFDLTQSYNTLVRNVPYLSYSIRALDDRVVKV